MLPCRPSLNPNAMELGLIPTDEVEEVFVPVVPPWHVLMEAERNAPL